MQVERSLFMNTLLRSKMHRPAYCAMLRNLHDLYAALEPALQRHAAHPAIAPIFSTALFRTQALVRDLGVLHGEGWRGELAVQPACVQYVQRLHEIDQHSPDLLVAHAYVRYLGDLSGGQLLRRIVATSFHLLSRGGTSFYDFGDEQETQRQLAQFRAGLANVTADDVRIARISAEATDAFERHETLFGELAVACGIGAGQRA